MNAIPKSDAERLSILNQAVLSYASKGYALSYKDEQAVTAVVKKKASINNTLHIILSLVTCGLWLTVWLIMALLNMNKEKVITINVDTIGRVTEYAN